jgi:hypothetical protein
MLLPAPTSIGFAADSEEEANANAASVYRRAFEQLPRSLEGYARSSQQQVMNNWQTAEIDQQVTQLLKDSEHSLSLLNRASQLDRCDWGIDLKENGPNTSLPHLEKARDLAGLAGLRARTRIQAGEHEAAVNDLLAVIALGRHIARDIGLMGQTMQHDLESMGVTGLARFAPELPKGLLNRLPDQIDHLPERIHPSSAMKTEKQIMVGWAVSKIQAEETDAIYSFLSKLQPLGQRTDANFDRRVRRAANRDPEKLKKLFNEMGTIYDRIAKAMDAPIAGFAAKAKEIETTIRQSGNPLLHTVPAFRKPRHWWARLKTRQHMLRAAIAYQTGGADSFAKVRDPHGKGPFDRQARDTGYLLRSDLTLEGQPVRLRVGDWPVDTGPST